MALSWVRVGEPTGERLSYIAAPNSCSLAISNGEEGLSSESGLWALLPGEEREERKEREEREENWQFWVSNGETI